MRYSIKTKEINATKGTKRQFSLTFVLPLERFIVILHYVYLSFQVGYEAGSKAQQLPPVYMNELDNELIPVLHNAVSQHEGGPVILELIFHIIE